MPQSVNDRRKEILESADGHLFTAIDRLFAIWADIVRQHPELGYNLANLMCQVEGCRFSLQQFYHLCWGGRPGWMLGMSEITHRLRQQRAEWAQEVHGWQEFGNFSEGSEIKQSDGHKAQGGQ